MDDIQVGFDVLKTSVSAETGRVTAQIGHMNGDGQVLSPNAEWWQTNCLISVPSKADPDKKVATKTVVIRQGGYDVIIASLDPRGLKLAGNLKPGEFALLAAGEYGEGQGRFLGKQDGSLTMMARKGNVAGGKAIIIQVDAQNDAIRLINSKGFGLIIDEDGAMLTAKGAALTLKEGGDASFIGTGQTQVDGAGILIGNLGLPGVNSALAGPTGLVGVASAKVLIQLFMWILFFESVLHAILHPSEYRA